MRKKILSAVIMLGMMLALVGCGSTESGASESAKPSESESATVSEKPSESESAPASEKPTESAKPSESESTPASEKPTESEKPSESESESEEPWPTMADVKGKKKEILAVNVFVTGSKPIKGGQNVYFKGNCDNEYFKGDILPGACDEQHYNPNSQRAIYTLEGKDAAGNDCKIDIENRSVQGGYIPKIHTDSPELAYLNDGPLTAEIQYVADGLIIHIFYWEQ